MKVFNIKRLPFCICYVFVQFGYQKHFIVSEKRKTPVKTKIEDEGFT
jgi:hypothetical protein